MYLRTIENTKSCFLCINLFLEFFKSSIYKKIVIMNTPLYLDYNATTPLSQEVQEVICTAMKNTWGNPSSAYDAGKRAKLLIEDSRSKVAKMVGAQEKEIIFTSGGTETNNMVIYSAIKQYHLENSHHSSTPHIITTNIEHDSVKLPLQKLSCEKEAEVSFVPVSKLTGQVNVDDIINAIKPNTCLITVMLANNETGIIQPVSAIGSRLKYYNSRSHIKKTFPKSKIHFHSDVAQAIGKIEIDVTDLGVDYLTIVGHKFYGPRIGALFFKISSPLHPMLYGGGQEGNYRPGTENACMIAGLGKASELVTHNILNYNKQMNNVRNYLESSLKEAFDSKVIFHNIIDGVDRLPNTVSVAFDYDNLTANDILLSSTICASTGAACHKSGKPSVILTFCGVSEYLAARTLRLSVGRETTMEDIDKTIWDLKNVIDKFSTK